MKGSLVSVPASLSSHRRVISPPHTETDCCESFAKTVDKILSITVFHEKDICDTVIHRELELLRRPTN